MNDYEENHDDEFLTHPNEFKLDDLIIDKDGVFDSSIIMYGPRRTGKSTLLLDILTFLQKNKYIGRIAVITTTDMNKFWKVHLPDSTVFGIEDAGDTINKIMDFMSYLITEDVDDGILRQYTFILDDFSWNKTFSIYNEIFAKLFTTGRHYNMSVIVLVQNPTGAMNWVRNNSDFSFIFKTPGFDAKERIWKDQLDFIHDKKLAFKFMDDNTMDFQCLVVKRTDPHATINDRLFVYKAKFIDIGGNNPSKKDLEKRTKFGDPVWRKKIEIEERYKKPKKKFKKYKKGNEIDFYSMNNAFKNGGINGISFKTFYNNI